MTAEQLDLLSAPVPAVIRMVRTEDPSTSHEAAHEAKRSAGRVRREALVSHQLHRDGQTDEEMVDDVNGRTEIPVVAGSLVKRRGELVAEGILRDSGRRRPTRTGCSAIVWELVPDGRPAAATYGIEL